MSLILGAQSAVATGFTVDNSCRFDAATGAWMYRAQETPTGTGTKASFSCWLKQGKYMATGGYIGIQDFAATSSFSIYENGGNISFNALNSSGYVGRRVTNAKLRDPGAWTHIFALWDSTESVAADRMQLWVNGVLQTSLLVDTDPPLDQVLDCLDNSVVTRQLLFSYSYGGGSYFDGYQAEMAFCDGQAYAPTDFGEFDEDSPTIWKPKDISGLTFGDAGWHLDFGDSASMGADVSGNGNDMTTVTNIAAINQCVDTPTNNFATFNAIDNYWQGFTYSEGNMTVTTTGFISPALSTMGLTAGKWYFEAKATDIHNIIGIQGTQITATGQYLGNYANDWGYYGSNGNSYNNGSSTSYGDTYTTSDIIGVAVDLDNNKLYFSKTNVWQNSGVPTSGATGTGALSIGAASATTPGYYLAGITSNTGSASTNNGNFGNPPYANSSDEADENGYGKFEYAPPSGYLAICTKNLGSDGG